MPAGHGPIAVASGAKLRSTPSGTIVMRSSGMPYAAAISWAEKVESVTMCAAERALRR
jgi:hypothetical protein